MCLVWSPGDWLFLNVLEWLLICSHGMDIYFKYRFALPTWWASTNTIILELTEHESTGTKHPTTEYKRATSTKMKAVQMDPYCKRHYWETAVLIELEWPAKGTSEMPVLRQYSEDRVPFSLNQRYLGVTASSIGTVHGPRNHEVRVPNGECVFPISRTLGPAGIEVLKKMCFS